MSKKNLPLAGVRVIEYANFVAAPICGRLLADWGAEVIKIEPDFGDSMRVVGVQWCFPTDVEENAMFEIENSGKKGIVVEEVKKRAPHIVYGHLLGYGDKGPAKDNPAFDYTAYFARGGVAMGLMEKGTSPANPVAGLGDHYAGMSLAAGIVSALYKKKETGKGERVTVSLFHTAVFGMGILVSAAHYGYKLPITRRQPPNPINTTFKCSDDKWIQIAFFQYDKWFPNFCNLVIERPDLIGGEYSTLRSAVKTGETFVIMLEEIFATKTSDEWCERLQKAGIPYEKLATPEDVLKDEQCWANDYLIRHTYENGHEGIIFNTPVMFTENPRGAYEKAPKLGEHTKEVFGEVGVSDAEIERLIADGIIK